MITFIILHYMVTNETKKCVDSILKLKGEKNIVVVDNQSPNNSKKELEDIYKENKNVHIIQNVENNGFAKGNNFGYEYVKKYIKSDFIVVMNNDMEIQQENFIEEIYKIYEEEKFYVLGPDIYSTYAKIHQNPEKRALRTYEAVEKELEKVKDVYSKKYMLRIKAILYKLPLMNRVKGYLKKIKESQNLEYSKKQYNVTLHGSCLIFSKLYLEKREKLFFDKTKFYCEAQILDYQCEKENMLRIYDPRIEVLHHEDVSTNAAHKNYIEKAQFMKNNMINSLNEFLKLIKEDTK